MKINSNPPTARENFLLTLLNKVVKEYKALLDIGRSTKPLKIASILHLSSIPGETKFSIQITNKNCALPLTAAEIIGNGYALHDFSLYHAEMIRQAAQGKLMQFLKLSDNNQPLYKIISKKLDRETQQYIFTIETQENTRFIRSAVELSKDKEILAKMNLEDIFDIGYTQGSESVVRERMELLLLKNGKNKYDQNK